MPALTPKREAVRLWRLERALELWITDSGTMGLIWSSRSDGIVADVDGTRRVGFRESHRKGDCVGRLGRMRGCG